jgi:hypothetical protein
VVHIRKRNIDDFVGSVLLGGGYVNNEGVIGRSPTRVQLDNDHMFGEQTPVMAELLLDPEVLFSLTGKLLVEALHKDNLPQDIILKGQFIDLALLTIEKAVRVSDRVLQEPVSIFEQTSREIGKRAQRLIDEAQAVNLLKRAGTSYGRPLVPKKPAAISFERRTVPKPTVREIPAHLLVRSAAAKIRTSQPDYVPHRVVQQPDSTRIVRIPGTVPERLLARSAEAEAKKLNKDIV